MSTPNSAADVLELTWWLPRRSIPPTPDEVIAALPDAGLLRPTRFGNADPPSIKAEASGANFREYWQGKVDAGSGIISWLGRTRLDRWALYFGPDTGAPDEVGRLTFTALASAVGEDAAADLLAAVGRTVGAIYGCLFVLRNWQVSAGRLMFDTASSEDSLRPAGTWWLGLPPKVPAIAWFGRSYADLVGSRPDHDYSDGLLLRGQAVKDAHRHEFLARRSDERFVATPPNLAATVIPSDIARR